MAQQGSQHKRNIKIDYPLKAARFLFDFFFNVVRSPGAISFIGYNYYFLLFLLVRPKT